MIDVVFLLLVFFMLAARFGTDGLVPVALGGSGGGVAYDGPPRLLDITSDGLRLNGISIPDQQLIAALEGLISAPDDVILVRPMGDTDVQRLVATLEMLRGHGFSQLVLVENAP